MTIRKISAHLLMMASLLFCAFSSSSLAASAAVTITGPDAPLDGSQYAATGGSAPYFWCISKGSITQNGTVKVADQCGTATITVTDSCGASATRTVRMPGGRWVNISSERAGCRTETLTWRRCDWSVCGTPESSDTWCKFAWAPASCRQGGYYCGVTEISDGYRRYTSWGIRYSSSTVYYGISGGTTTPPFDGAVAVRAIVDQWRCADGSNAPENSSCTPPSSSVTITAFDSSNPKMKPGDTLTFSGSLSKSADWTMTIADRTFTGSGSSVSVQWDGKDSSGNLVPPTSYNATLFATCCDGKYSDTKSLAVEVVSSCNVRITSFSGSRKMISSAGGSIGLSGSISAGTDETVTWTIAVEGKTYSGTGTAPSANWDGKDGAGKMLDPGSYEATLTARSADGKCSASSSVPITITPAGDGACDLYVQVGSSANVASGALTHSQELFSAKRTGPAVGMALHYNSQESHSGSTGASWSHSYDIFLKKNDDGSVVLQEGNGNRRLYTVAGGSYVSGPGDYSELVRNPDETFTITEKDGTKHTFATGGAIKSIADRNGNAVSFTYSEGRLSTITDPAGASISLAYDGAGHLTSVTDPGGGEYTLGYGGNTLTSVTYPDGSRWFYSYDSDAFMLSRTDPLGNRTSYAYDADKRVVSATDPEGRIRSLAYPQAGNDTTRATTFTEKDGGVWTYSYDTLAGTLVSKTDPEGGVTGYTYDASGNRTSTTLPDGTQSSYSYDDRGNMTSATDALGQTTSYTYNEYGQIMSVKDPEGNSTAYSYDAGGNLASVTDAAGASTEYQYDVRGNVTKITNPLGQTTTFGYADNGNLVSVTEPSGATTTYTYDAAGNVAGQTDGSGSTTRFAYDSRNQLVKVTGPQGEITSYGYDLSGNRISETDANGNTTSYEYNYKGEPVKMTDALGNITTFAYGSAGCASCGGGADKLTSLTDANGNSTKYRYDALGRVVSETDPLGNKTTYSYDARGNLASKTDANGAITTYAYDPLGRLLRKSYPDGTETTFTYDVKGNILTAANGTVSYMFAYDAKGQMVRSSDSAGRAISYEYDVIGNRTKVISPDGRTIIYTYDSFGRLKSIVDGGTFTFGYDGAGRRSTLSYPNGDRTTFRYDGNGRLLNLVHRNAKGELVGSNSYTHDKVGNRLSNAMHDRSLNYEYDHIYRLTEATSSSPGYSSNNTGKGGGIANAVQQQKEWYRYDPVGNRLSSEKVSSYEYSEGNQLISNGGKYSYDNNGNLVEKINPDGKTTYAWDYENRLTRVVTPDGAVLDFAYDPFGRRIAKKVEEGGATTTTRYFYDDHNILFEYDDIGATGNRYTHGPGIDEHFSVATGKEKYYYHADGLGSTAALTDSAGKLVQRYEYDSFGNLKDQKRRVKQPYAYTGREWDKETGLYFLRGRIYDPTEGRFISKDPIGFKGRDVNLYAYVHNNPINYIDPYGLSAMLGALPIAGGFAAADGPLPIGDIFAGAIIVGAGAYDLWQSFNSRLPTGSKPIDQTPWSGDHKDIKGGVGAGPRDKVWISPDDGVWTQNPDGSYEEHGHAGDYTRSGKPSGQSGKDRDKKHCNRG